MKKEYLHESIKTRILEQIQAGSLRPGEKLPKTKELAKNFQTSSVTIDKALSKLMELGYIDRRARKGTLVTPKAEWPETDSDKLQLNRCGLLMRDSPSPYLWKNIIQGIQSVKRKQNFDILTCYITENLKEACVCIEELRNKNVQGIIFRPISMPTQKEYEGFNASIIDLMGKYEIPFVLIDRFIQSRDTSYIISQNYHAAVILTKQLFSLGVKKPLCLTHLYNSSFAGRIDGFKDTLKKYGCSAAEADERIVNVAPNSILFDANNPRVHVPLFRNLPDFDGIFAVSAICLYTCVNTLAYLRDSRATRMRYVNVDYIGPLNIPGLAMSAIQESRQMGQLAGEMLRMIPRWKDSSFHVLRNYTFRTWEE
jgi:DNA-binding LacI/PurR family transcriptional regulator